MFFKSFLKLIRFDKICLAENNYTLRSAHISLHIDAKTYSLFTSLYKSLFAFPVSKLSKPKLLMMAIRWQVCDDACQKPWRWIFSRRDS